MECLYPEHRTMVDAYDAYRPRDPSAQLLRVNMVSSLDGHIVTSSGRSSGLGGDGDREVFFVLRHLADAVMVGAGTVRAEDYGSMKIRPELRERREADGRTQPAPIVVVTRSLQLNPDARVFHEAVTPTYVVTAEDVDANALDAIRAVGAVVIQAGEGAVDLDAALGILREEHGLAHILCEGGPTLNAGLLEDDLVDELCLTVSPIIIGGGDAKRIVGPMADGREADVLHVLRAGAELLLRYSLRTG